MVVQEAVCVCLPCVTEMQLAVTTVPDCLLPNCRLSMVAAKPTSTYSLLAGGLIFYRKCRRATRVGGGGEM